jgi:hypothetical protein
MVGRVFVGDGLSGVFIVMWDKFLLPKGRLSHGGTVCVGDTDS